MKTLSILHTLAILTFSTTAGAISLSIDGSTCGSCEGANLLLDIVDQGGTFDVTLTINSDGYIGNRDGMVVVGFGGISGWTSVVLDGSPGMSAVGWTDPIGANVSSSGRCANGSTTDKVCSSGYVDISAGGDYTWAFTVTGGTLRPAVADWHIGGQFAYFADLSSRKGPRGHLISESGQPVPEPGAALLFGAGMLLVAACRGAGRRGGIPR
jgi:hypothetical protein